MLRNKVYASLIKQFITPPCPASVGTVRTAHQKGKQPLAYGLAYVAKWTNETGKENLRRVMPGFMQISRERRGHLWGAKELASESAVEAGAETQDSDLNQARDLAVVPSFARFSEFREADLNFEPTKLHCVWRVAALSGRPKYEKAIMVSLKLDTPIHKMVILRNTPEINYKLWQVKHLLRIKPLSFPDGIPSQDNFKAFLLKRNGQFVQSKLSRENYRRERNRPELEKYVLLREEQECGMRHKWFVGSLDGTLLPTLSIHSHPTVLPENMGKAQLGKGCTSTERKRRDM